MVDVFGYPFLIGLWFGALAGAGLAALFFAHVPPPPKTWIARGSRNVLTIRRAPRADDVPIYHHRTEPLLLTDAMVISQRDQRYREHLRNYCETDAALSHSLEDVRARFLQSKR